METITIDAVIDENHQLVVQVPGIAPGHVKVTVERIENNPADEQVRSILRSAGLLTDEEPFAEALEVSDDELDRVGRVFAADRPMSELIDEDREERF